MAEHGEDEGVRRWLGPWNDAGVSDARGQMRDILARFVEEVFADPARRGTVSSVLDYAVERAGPELVSYVEGRCDFHRMTVVFAQGQPKYAGLFFPLTCATDQGLWAECAGRAMEALVLLRFEATVARSRPVAPRRAPTADARDLWREWHQGGIQVHPPDPICTMLAACLVDDDAADESGVRPRAPLGCQEASTA